MLKRMAFPTASAARRRRREAASRDVVMGERSCPHNVRARLVVLGLGKSHGGLVDKGANNARGDVIGKARRTRAAEIALAHMRDHVGHASGRLIRRQRKRELGVEERYLRAEQIRIRAALQSQFIVGNNT